jgi:hypothetical protein
MTQNPAFVRFNHFPTGEEGKAALGPLWSPSNGINKGEISKQ